MADVTEVELRKLAEAATPGPWAADDYIYTAEDDDARVRVTSPSDGDDYNLAEGVLRSDAEYIAAASPDRVLELLDALASVRTENAGLRADLDARFEHSDHRSAKYHKRMRVAERAAEAARESARILGDLTGDLGAQLQDATAIIGRIEIARSNHPECDEYPEGGAITCGWKRAVQDIDRVLSTDSKDGN